MKHKIKERIKFMVAYVIWLFKKPKFPKYEKVLIHIGNGNQHDERYINIDARPLPNVHIVSKRIHKLNKFKDNSVDLIYVCHIMEHVKYFDLDVVFKEFFRVLKPNGLLRISVPDFDNIINIYNKNDNDINTIKNMLLGGQDYKYNFHYSVFNKKYLQEKLLNQGFNSTNEWDPSTAKYYTFDDWASKKCKINDVEFEISLNLEGIK